MRLKSLTGDAYYNAASDCDDRVTTGAAVTADYQSDTGAKRLLAVFACKVSC